MPTQLKSFRLDKNLIPLLKQMAKERGVSEATIIEAGLEKLSEEDRQWEEDLILIATDEEYKKEQLELAEENYED